MLVQARHVEAIFHAVQSRSEAAQSIVAASWRRSLLQHKLEPDTRRGHISLSDNEFRCVRERMGPVVSIAEPTLSRLFKSVGKIGCCILLSDVGGRVVNRRSNAADEKTFDGWGLRVGNVWDENSEGTNGIGTCIVEKCPVTIHGDQHFFARNTAMSCIDAPIFGANGKLLAVLNVSSCRSDDTEAYLALIAAAVTDSARRIESNHFRAAFADSRILMCDEKGGHGVVLLAVDQDDLVVGATRSARLLYDLDDISFVKPRPAQDVISGIKHGSDLRKAERGEIKRALARNNGNISAAARQLGIGRATIYRRMHRLHVR